jgi:phosphoribosylamine---glycine ligase
LSTLPASRLLVVGSGGREHALAWRLSLEPGIENVFVAPGNAGTARTNKIRNCPIAATDIESLLTFAKTENILLTIVGPEVPLSLGIVDQFQAAGLAIFGPTKAAAELETSKAYTKDFLARHKIPTAHYGIFTAIDPALAYIELHGAPIVVKADGLAAGKGVVVAQSVDEAKAAVRDMLGGKFANAGARVVIEEFLDGEEASYIVIASGTDFVPMASSQDHKRVGDGDSGPNTGGMGAYSPAPIVSPIVEARIQREIIIPTLQGMQAEGRPFSGFLYAGVMIDAAGNPKVLEFNTRMGDPETQPIMSRLKSGLLDTLQAAAAGQLAGQSLQWDARVALGVVLCAAGYPDAVKNGKEISGLSQNDLPNTFGAFSAQVFHAGTQFAQARLASVGADLPDEPIVTAGGRVLCVVGLADSVQGAQQNAYQRADAISWPGCFMRRDIGWRAL